MTNNIILLVPIARLMFGFMLPSWFLSMWISNTATTAMMLPMVEAVLSELEGSEAEENEKIEQQSVKIYIFITIEIYEPCRY